MGDGVPDGNTLQANMPALRLGFQDSEEQQNKAPILRKMRKPRYEVLLEEGQGMLKPKTLNRCGV